MAEILLSRVPAQDINQKKIIYIYIIIVYIFNLYIFETKSIECSWSTDSHYGNFTHKASLWRNKTLQSLENTKGFT